MDWIIGFGGSLVIAGAAYKKGSLSKSGMIAAIGVGTMLVVWGSLTWFVLMIGFFVSSSMLTKWKHSQKKDAESLYQKSGRRDAGQVLANGGAGVLLCGLHALRPDMVWTLWAYIGVMATVTADTWATEIGGLSKHNPRSILTWRPVSKGTSGGVTSLGWLAAASGGIFIGAAALLASYVDHSLSVSSGWSGWTAVIWIAAAAGWCGANADSVLGATIQSLYYCPVCGKELEASEHCGQPTLYKRGWRWLDNDAVNAISSLVGGCVSAALAAVFIS